MVRVRVLSGCRKPSLIFAALPAPPPRGGAREGRRSLSRDSGIAHAFESRLELREMRRIVAHRRPSRVEASDGESRDVSEAGLGCGMGLVWATKLRKGGAQHKIDIRKISVGLDRPPVPTDRLLPTAGAEVCEARPAHPDVSIRIARTEAQTFGDVSLCFFGATDENLTEANISMGVRKISIKLKSAFTFGDAFCGALGPYIDESQPHVAAWMVRDQRQGLDQFRFGRREGRGGIGPEQIYAFGRVRARRSDQRFDVAGIGYERAIEAFMRLRHILRGVTLVEPGHTLKIKIHRVGV